MVQMAAPSQVPVAPAWERGWIDFNMALLMAQVARENPAIPMEVIQQFIRHKTRNVVEIASANLQQQRVGAIFELDVTKTQVLESLRRLHKYWVDTSRKVPEW